MKNENDIVLVSGARTAIGSLGGSLSDVHQHELGAITIKAAIKRANLSPEQVDEVIVGNVGQIAESGFIARVCQLRAGVPQEATSYSVNRQCGSGLQAIINGMMSLQTGAADIVVACGTENMTQLPYYLRKARFGYRLGNDVLEDGITTILTWPEAPFHNGVTAENVADKFNVSRIEMDEYSLSSQSKALKAIEAGYFKEQIVPVTIKVGRKETKNFEIDEYPRYTPFEKLSTLKPVFKSDGKVTAANSSGINDGAAAVVLTTRKKAEVLGLDIKMSIKGWAVAGCEAELMGIGPVTATKKLLKQTGLCIDDLDVIEINEAFAAQVIACIKELKADPIKVNPNGGAIALGHPVGATGCIIPVKLMYEMERTNKKLGLVTMCIGGGQGISMIFENEKLC